MIFQELSRSHDRKSFVCGNKNLEVYFRQYAAQDVRNRLTHCFVMLDEETGRIAGFYTLSHAGLLRQDLPAELRVGAYSDLPFERLGRFAVASDFQHQGLGTEMLANAIRRVMESPLSPYGIVVDMKTPDLIRFYGKLGFIRLGDSNRCVLIFSKLTCLPG